MLYDSTRTLLQSIRQSLERADEAAWDDRVELGNRCLYEIHQISRASHQAYRKDDWDARWPAAIPYSEKARRAMPHVKLMMSAMRRRDQAAALESAKAALAAM